MSDATDAMYYTDRAGVRWAPIPHHQLYTVSETGYIRNEKFDKLLKPKRPTGNGRKQVILTADDGSRHAFYIHRLVAEAFLENYDPDCRVLHITPDLNDNSVQNLKMSDYLTGGRQWN